MIFEMFQVNKECKYNVINIKNNVWDSIIYFQFY